MQLVVRRPDAAYYDTHLWLPKSHVSSAHLRSLVYPQAANKEDLVAWREERDHYLVPRNYLELSAFHKLPYPVYDTRLRSFPYIKYNINPRYQLDGRDPNKTFQRDSVRILKQTQDGILCLRCGAGKSFTGLAAAAEINTPVMVVVSDLGLAEQWREEILEVTDIREEDIGFIGDGQFDWQKPIVIALVQSLAARVKKDCMPPELSAWFGVILIDECHVMGSPYWNAVVPYFHGRRWGLSATPNRADAYDSLLKATVGQVVYRYLEPELIPQVFFRRLPTKLQLKDPLVREAVFDKTGELHLRKIYNYLATLDVRTKIMAKEIAAAIQQGRQVLALSQSREMIEALARHFPKAGVCHGGVKDRKERLRRIRECNPVIAIDRLGRQALNKPCLDTLFVIEPFSDMGVIQQMMGRVQRFYDGKQHPMVVFYDETGIKTPHAMCNRIRKLLSHWPTHMGGRIPFTNA